MIHAGPGPHKPSCGGDPSSRAARAETVRPSLDAGGGGGATDGSGPPTLRSWPPRGFCTRLLVEQLLVFLEIMMRQLKQRGTSNEEVRTI